MQLRLRFAPAILAGLMMAGILAAVALAASPGAPVAVSEPAGDAGTGAPDLVKVELSRSSDGRLRASLRFAESVPTKSLVAKSGPPGSVCMRIYASDAAKPGVLPPDFLVCATPDSKGKALHGSVLAEQINRLPKKIGSAVVTRASTKSVVMRFSQSAVGRPAIIKFAGEATKAGCVRMSCVDTVPDAPDTAKLLVRAEAPADR
jgi:hypothetical protein